MLVTTHIEFNGRDFSRWGRGVFSHSTVLEITVGHWPLSDQFQHLADQNPFWSAIFPVHFQWNSNQYPIKIPYLQKNGRPISDPYFSLKVDHILISVHCVTFHFHIAFQYDAAAHLYTCPMFCYCCLNYV